MKAMLTAAALALLAAPLAMAQDGGGSISNTTKAQTPDFDIFGLTQQNSITGWFRAPFTNDGSFYFATEESLDFKYTSYDLSEGGDATIMADISLLKFGALFRPAGGTLRLSAGRFYVSDATGIIFAQNADGILLNFDAQWLAASLYGGYTGLLNARYVTILDETRQGYRSDDDKLYDFAASYAVGGLSLSLPYLVLNQTVGVEGYAMLGASGPGDADGNFNRFYATLSLNGPIVKDVFYTATTTFGADEHLGGVSNLTQALFTYYPPVLNTSLSASALYASGGNGPLESFTGFTSSTATLAYQEPEYSGLFKFGIAASIKPAVTLVANLGADIVFACPENTFDYDGFQWYASARYQLFSDFQLGLQAFQYYGNKSDAHNSAIIFNAVISF